MKSTIHGLFLILVLGLNTPSAFSADAGRGQTDQQKNQTNQAEPNTENKPLENLPIVQSLTSKSNQSSTSATKPKQQGQSPSESDYNMLNVTIILAVIGFLQFIVYSRWIYNPINGEVINTEHLWCDGRSDFT